VLCCVAALWFAVRALKDGRTRWLVLSGVCVGLGLETKRRVAPGVVPGIGVLVEHPADRVLLLVLHVPYAVYARATSGINFLLIPATIALAVPLYRELAAIVRHSVAIVPAIVAGSATSAISAVWIARAFGCDLSIVRSFAPKSVTTPVAMAVSAQLGGVPSLSAVFAILAGIVGAVAATLVLRVWNRRIAGVAVGTVAHGVGTSRLLALDSLAGAFSGLAMGLNAILTAILLPLLARFFVPVFVLFIACAGHALAQSAPLVFVPLDDRPVTLQLPLMLGEIAGRRIVAPPRSLLGRYLQFGKPDTIISWLNAGAPPNAQAYVLSSDMLAYGGLVASRVPGTTYADAYFRTREFSMLHRAHPDAWIGAFGTVMRLAPTGVPAIGDARNFFAAYPVWPYLQQYANLPDPPGEKQRALAEQLRASIGEQTLAAGLADPVSAETVSAASEATTNANLFSIDGMLPRFRWRIAGRLIERRTCMDDRQNRTLLSYRLLLGELLRIRHVQDAYGDAEFRHLHSVRHAQAVRSHMLDMGRPGVDERHVFARARETAAEESTRAASAHHRNSHRLISP